MKAKDGVVNLLNKILTEELTVINQYFLHAKMCKNWGYDRLHHHVMDRSLGEMKDATAIIDHILYLDGLPNMQRLGTVKIGETVPEQLKVDLDKEKEMVKDEEEHIDWIETQLETIKQVGLQNYLSEQIKHES
jgi:bacterioferritin